VIRKRTLERVALKAAVEQVRGSMLSASGGVRSDEMAVSMLSLPTWRSDEPLTNANWWSWHGPSRFSVSAAHVLLGPFGEQCESQAVPRVV